jgi:hypothetical protein
MAVRGEAADSDVSIVETDRPGAAACGDRPGSRASPDRAERFVRHGRAARNYAANV